MNTRFVAARVLAQVVAERQSLAAALPQALAQIAERDRGLLQELCYGTLRWYPQLEYLLERLVRKPPRNSEVWALLLIGLYQLLHLRIPAYATVSETVIAARGLGKSWSGLVNGVLRNFQRRREVLLAELSDETLSAHPAWLLRRIKTDWPQDWQTIVAANNAYPPFSLRINLSRLSRSAYLQRLGVAGIAAVPGVYSKASITLNTPCDVDGLPGFAEGLVSVQDPAAQLAVEVLDLRPRLRVLDACAAPGGKTCHILEHEPVLTHLLALDVDAERLTKVIANLQRLGLTAHTRVGDALRVEDWWNGLPYDRILLDAPCSGSGVIRRHPDIKILRKPADIDRLAQRQRAMLERLWPLLGRGGMLVYATCSVLKQENEQVVTDFLVSQPDATERVITAPWGRAVAHGRQILPGEAGMDGFYYACLVKS